MKAYIVPRAGALELVEVADPVIGPFDALVKINICGICNSTDAKLIDGTMFWAPQYPFVLGHESVGTVVEVGKNVTKFRVGDRVTRPVFRSNGGINAANGGFAELGVVVDGPARAAAGDESVMKDYNALRQNVVPNTLSDADAALCISLSETASLLDDLPNISGKTVVVGGTGAAGVSTALWCKLAGARTVALGRRQERLEWAKKVGADIVVSTAKPDWAARLTSEIGKADGIIEMSGSVALASEAIGLIGDDGFAIAYGVPPTGSKYSANWKNPAVNEHLRYTWVADLMQRGIVRSSDFISHTWRFDQLPEAMESVRRGEVLKGFVTISA